MPTDATNREPADRSPYGSILDVDGIGVGHHQRSGRGWQTGTTVVTAVRGAVPGVDVRGGGPGTRETDALRPENLVNDIHAVCLTGGSAFGLAAADGVMAELEERGLGVPVGQGLVVPVVPTAVIFDLGRGGVGANRPDPTFGRKACVAALSPRSRVRWGSVGAGTGARSGGLQGGVGTASTQVSVLVPPHLVAVGGSEAETATEPTTLTFSVGAVSVVNSHGSAIDPASGLPWERPGRSWPRVSRAARQRLDEARQTVFPASLNTTIGVVATDLCLDKAEASKVATVAHDGLARAIRPAHALVDGDTVFTLATGAISWPSELKVPIMNALTEAAADVFAAASTHAITSAVQVGEWPAWSDLV